MKRAILIIAILLIGNSLKSQDLPLTIDANNTSGMLNYTVSPDPYYPDPQPKASQRRHLKSQIADLVVIGAGMYIFRDQLTEFSNKHDKIAHGVLAFGLTKYFGWRFAAGFMLSIEATQGDIFGLRGRYKDTAVDLLANGFGIFLAIKF